MNGLYDLLRTDSWNATGTSCIVPRSSGAQMNRPNGSTGGRRALSRAIDGQPYGDATCGGPKSISGLVDFARSSAGPATGDTGTNLTYLPYARDAVTFGWYANGVATPVTSLTRAQLTTLFSTGPQTINGVNVVPCGIQLNSGTYNFWLGATNVTAAQEATGTATCNAAGNGSRLQENDGIGLKAKGDAQVGSEVIVGYSAGNFIAQKNGVVTPSQVPAGVDIGAISDNGSGTNLGEPYSLSGTTYSPNATFYNDNTFGRNIYNVFPTNKVTGVGNADLKSRFVGTTSVICSSAAQTIVNSYGFTTLASGCGATTTKGSLITGTF